MQLEIIPSEQSVGKRVMLFGFKGDYKMLTTTMSRYECKKHSVGGK